MFRSIDHFAALAPAGFYRAGGYTFLAKKKASFLTIGTLDLSFEKKAELILEGREELISLLGLKRAEKSAFSEVVRLLQDAKLYKFQYDIAVKEARLNNLKAVKAIISNDPYVNDYRDILEVAVFNNCPEIVKYLLHIYGKDIEQDVSVLLEDDLKQINLTILKDIVSAHIKYNPLTVDGVRNFLESRTIPYVSQLLSSYPLLLDELLVNRQAMYEFIASNDFGVARFFYRQGANLNKAVKTLIDIVEDDNMDNYYLSIDAAGFRYKNMLGYFSANLSQVGPGVARNFREIFNSTFEEMQERGKRVERIQGMKFLVRGM